ncbi:MAG: DUF559 domain-containing protein [Candidatus Nanopelagicales bacterium]
MPRPVVTSSVAVPEVASGQDGVFTRTQARTEGWSDDRQRSLVQAGTWCRLAGPVLHHAQTSVGPWQRARAVSLTAGLVVSHTTAGALWGMCVDDTLHGIGHVARRARPVVAHRIPLRAGERIEVAGLVVTSPMRTLTDLLCGLPHEAAVTMATEALRLGLVTPGDLRVAAALAHGRTGAPRARELAETCRGGPHSHLEWRFHRLIGGLGDLGARWRFNVDVHDGAGFVGRVDAIHDEAMVVVELDGRQFHGPENFQSDRTRDQRLIAMGYVVLRFTWQDVEQRPWEVLARIRATLRVRAGVAGRTA